MVLESIFALRPAMQEVILVAKVNRTACSYNGGKELVPGEIKVAHDIAMGTYNSRTKTIVAARSKAVPQGRVEVRIPHLDAQNYAKQVLKGIRDNKEKLGLGGSGSSGGGEASDRGGGDLLASSSDLQNEQLALASVVSGHGAGVRELLASANSKKDGEDAQLGGTIAVDKNAIYASAMPVGDQSLQMMLKAQQGLAKPAGKAKPKQVAKAAPLAPSVADAKTPMDDKEYATTRVILDKADGYTDYNAWLGLYNKVVTTDRPILEVWDKYYVYHSTKKMLKSEQLDEAWMNIVSLDRQKEERGRTTAHHIRSGLIAG